MPIDHRDNSGGVARPEVLREMVEQLLKSEEFSRAVGRKFSLFLIATITIASLEFAIGLPLITLATTPVAGAVLVFLYAEVETWIRSRKPTTVYWLCPDERRFMAIAWASLAKYRKWKSCPDCGAPWIKRCQSGKHYIVSPGVDDSNERHPRIDGVCPFCDPKLPIASRVYLQRTPIARRTASAVAADWANDDDTESM